MNLEIKVTTGEDLIKAVPVLNQEGGKLLISGKVTLKEDILFRKPISIEGINDAEILLSNNINGIRYLSKPHGAYPATCKEMSEQLSTSVTLKPGNFILVESDVKLDMVPHNPGGTQHPLELHQVNTVTKGGVSVESFIVDPMENGRLAILEPLSNFSISNLRFTFNGVKQRNYANVLRLDGVANINLENLHITRMGPGGIMLNNAYNCIMRGCRIDGTAASDGVYGIVAGLVNGLLIDDCFITGCRHSFTTTAGKSNGRARYGNGLNIVLQNSIIHVPTKMDINASRVGLDTHAEGWGIIFKNNTINVGTGTVNIAMQTRSRNTIFDGNIVRGGVPSKGCRILEKNAIVVNNSFLGGWYGVELNSDGAYLSRNFYQNLAASPVFIRTGSNNVIDGCAAQNVTFQPSSGFKKGELVRDDGKNNKINI